MQSPLATLLHPRRKYSERQAIGQGEVAIADAIKLQQGASAKAGLEERMAKTPLLLVPGVLCSPRLFAGQIAALSEQADIVVPDWRKAPLSIWDTWDSAARWVLAQMPAEQVLPGRAVAGRHAGRRNHADRGRPGRPAGPARHRHAQPERDRAGDPARPASGSPTRAISSWCWACRCRVSSRPTACPTRRWSAR